MSTDPEVQTRRAAKRATKADLIDLLRRIRWFDDGEMRHCICCRKTADEGCDGDCDLRCLFGTRDPYDEHRS